MYHTRNFKHRIPNGIGGFIEDLFQNGKVFTDDLWNDEKNACTGKYQRR